ncbi:MAG: TlpA family protein disulfide reductase [Gallionella sp.]|nr:TlpA family protein disulfide reductase [Gallionella sp.]
MPTVTPAPLPLPIAMLLLVVALLVAAWTGRMVGRRRQAGIGSILIGMLLAAILVSRIAFVAVWFDNYRSAPWSMLDILDGGFIPWVGMIAAMLVAVWRGWNRVAVRKPLILGLAAGALAWEAMFGAIVMMNNTALPGVPLTTLSGAPADLATLAGGKPMVVNLWASWCPPCRREMPVLAAAQKNDREARFVFVNQGENGATARNFLSAARLDLDNVLLDPSAGFGREVGSTALPTTLFYNANGRLVDTHLGELSVATLESKLNQLRSHALLINKE